MRVQTTGYENQHVTVMLCTSAASWRLPPYIVLKKGKKKKGTTFPKGVAVRVKENVRTTRELILDWI